MARFLIGWELGGGHGHAVNMVTLGRALVARGHEVFMSARDIGGIWPVTRDAGIPVLQSPAYNGNLQALTGGNRFQARRFSDVLAVFGYGSQDALEPQARAWEGLLNVVRPDVVVAEFAPTLCLAARQRLPTVAFGIGYCLPCLQDGEFPLLYDQATALLRDSHLRDGIGKTLQALGRDVPADPFEALLGDEQLMISMGEIDPYRAARKRAALGPLASLPPLAPPPLAPHCLVYLPAEHPYIDAIVECLVAFDMPGIAYIRGAPKPLLDALRKTRLEVSTAPIDLGEHLPRATVMMHHGGPGTVQRCLAAGVPQVVAPTNLEQRLVARSLEELGVGLTAGDVDAARRSGQLLAQAARDDAMRDRARALAETVQAKYPVGSLDAVVAACVARIG